MSETTLLSASPGFVVPSGALVAPGGQPGPVGLTGQGTNPNILYCGTCEIDQANEGATVNSASGAPYAVDGIQTQWNATGGTANGGRSSSGVAPPGFIYSVSMQTLTAATTPNFAWFRLPIEGNDIVDWNIGTANAGILTLSFWGMLRNLGAPYTFNAVLSNSALTRGYPVNLTFTATGVWQQFTVQFPLDTGGTWTGGNTMGAMLGITMSCAATYQAPANTWTTGSTYIFGTSANTNTFQTTANATINITGIKLERGNVATPFFRDPFAIMLHRAQRLYEKSYDFGVAVGTSGGPPRTFNSLGDNNTLSGANIWMPVFYRVTKRAPSTLTYYDAAGTAGRVTQYTNASGWTNGNTPSGIQYNQLNGFVMAAGSASPAAGYISFDWVADSRL